MWSDKRAMTNEAKREAVERLLRAWEMVPDRQLGQLISVAWGNDPVHAEDLDLVEAVEAYAYPRRRGDR